MDDEKIEEEHRRRSPPRTAIQAQPGTSIETNRVVVSAAREIDITPGIVEQGLSIRCLIRRTVASPPRSLFRAATAGRVAPIEAGKRQNEKHDDARDLSWTWRPSAARRPKVDGRARDLVRRVAAA